MNYLERERGSNKWVAQLVVWTAALSSSSVLVLGASCSFTAPNGGIENTQIVQENRNAVIENAVNAAMVDVSEVSQAASVTTPSVTITITNGGFEPASTKIIHGQTVKWINAEATPHWPVSDPHPAHTDHPELDPLHELGQGETFLVTFMKSETIRYHDHLYPEHVGTILVE